MAASAGGSLLVKASRRCTQSDADVSALPETAHTHGSMTLAHVSVNALLRSCALQTRSSVERHATASACSRARVGKESTAIVTTVIVSAATSPLVQVLTSGTIPAAAAKKLPRSDVLNAFPTHTYIYIVYLMLASSSSACSITCFMQVVQHNKEMKHCKTDTTGLLSAVTI